MYTLLLLHGYVGDVVPGVVVWPYLDGGIFHFHKIYCKLRNKQSG